MNPKIGWPVLWLVLASCVTTQDGNGSGTETGPQPAGESGAYETGVAGALEGGEAPDLARLREEYIASDYFRSEETALLLAEMKRLDEKRDWAGVTQLAEANLTRYFVNIEFHYLAMKAYKNLEDDAQYRWHRKMLYAIVQELMARGDGRSPETAYSVISINEIYVIMNFMGLRYSERTAFPLNGHFFEQYSVEPNEYYRSRVIYFNVDVPMGKEE